MDHLDSLGNSFQLHRLIDYFELGDIDPQLGAGFIDQVLVTYKGNLDETHFRSLGAGLDSVLIHGPGRDHTLANTLFLEFCKNVCEFCNH